MSRNPKDLDGAALAAWLAVFSALCRVDDVPDRVVRVRILRLAQGWSRRLAHQLEQELRDELDALAPQPDDDDSASGEVLYLEPRVEEGN